MKYLISVLTFTLIFLSSSAFSEAGYRKGTIQYIRTHDESIGEAWESPTFWFTLNGVAEAGSCPKWGGNILFVANTPQAYSMIMASFMAGKEVAVRYDDTHQNAAAYCVVKHITVGNPPPLH